jgi:hypothetical protein
MNTDHWLRTLFAERQAQLYTAVGAILPPWMSARHSAGE